MNLVDSSGWLEYFADGPNAAFYAPALEDAKNLIVPSVCIYEVFKKVFLEKGENNALQAVALMQQGEIIALDITLSLNASKISLEMKLPMAASIILATAKAHDAVIWTQDADFEKISGVKFISKKKE